MDPDPESISYLAQILFIIVLTLLNAFFASAEMSAVSVNKTKIRILAQEGDKRAKTLRELLEQPNRLLSTIQVVITLSGFLASASAATSMAGDIGKVFSKFGLPYGTQIAVVLVTVALSYVSLVFGELYPKRMALRHAEKIALFSARPVFLISKLAAPFVWLLSKSVNLLLRLTGVDENDIEEKYSEEEIRSLLEVGQETGLIKEAGKEMITSIFEFDDKLAYEIMTPRTNVYMINIREPLKNYVNELLEERFSRVPVYDRDVDDIVGVLYMKDYFLKAKRFGFENVHIEKILQKPFFVPESKNIDDLFREMQSSKIHIALLIDEYGGFSGIVTIEDIIEEIMGNIDDEYDDDEPRMEQIGENTWLLDGQYYLDDLNEKLALNIESDQHETIGGYVMNRIGEIPGENDPKEYIVEEGSCVFKVKSMKERRIDKILLRVNPKPEEEAGDRS
ncbi:MAG: hemolysin family protein [Clostridiales Family XIII bacterium]|jgi:putative hemolysin|nr:hemolysin family protein [Clostridiales Family XIII bacterium]